MSVQEQNSTQYFEGPLLSGSILSITEFTFIDNSHVAAKLRGENVNWVYGTDYTVSGAGTSTRTITILKDVAVDKIFAVFLDVPITQMVSPEEGGNFPAAIQEMTLDKLTYICQMLYGRITRAVQVSIDSNFDGLLYDSASQSGKAIIINELGTGLTYSTDKVNDIMALVRSILAQIQNIQLDVTTKSTAAATSATNASTSETNALASKNAAAISATNASTSETNASTSETNALASKNAAATSETNAGSSADRAEAAAGALEGVVPHSGDEGKFLRCNPTSYLNGVSYEEVQGGGLTINPLGTITTDQTLVAMNATTAHVADTVAISLPTALTASIENVVVFDFTTTSTSQPTIMSSRDLTGTCAVTNGDATVTGTSTLFLTELEVGSKITIATVDYQVLSIASDTSLELTANYAGTTASGLTVGHKFIKWSDKNGGKAPTAYSIISGVRNILVFKTHNNGVTWEVEYGSYGGVETAFVQPTLSSNGILGGTTFAVVASSENAGYYAWCAFDKNLSNAYWSAAGKPTGYLILYNPIAVKATSFDFTGVNGYYVTGGAIYGSNDNINYTVLASFTNNNFTTTPWNVQINNGSQGYYKYYKIYFSGMTAGNAGIAQVLMNGIYISA